MVLILSNRFTILSAVIRVIWGELSYHYAFDVDDERDAQISLVSTLRKAVQELNVDGYVEGAESSRESFYSLYGGLFFIGIFLGLLFYYGYCVDHLL